MKSFKRSAVLLLALCCLFVFMASPVLADETETGQSDYELYYADTMTEGEFISTYVDQIVEFLSLYAREGVTNTRLYKAALLEVLEQHPELYETVMDAMLSSIDEHSVFYKSGEYEQFISQLESAVGGIGITFNEMGGNLVVGTVYEDTPAEKAGIQSGDILYSADDNSLIGVSTAVAQSYIRGEIGTTVVVGVLRDGYDEPLYFTMIREEIAEKQSVSYSVIEGTDVDDATKTRKIMYIRIYSFMDNTAEQFATALADADENGITDLIIDLRDNGGGYLYQAVEIADNFVPNGNVIVKEDHSADIFDVTYISERTREIDNDIVVLVNENSASASEVLTAALSENGVATVIGTTTYGKGTVQSSVALKDGEAMKYTCAYYLTPNGNNIDGIGITPDAVVENSTIPFDYSGYSDFDYASIYSLGDDDINVARAKSILAVWGWYAGDETSTYFDSELETVITEFQSYTGLYPYGVLDLTTQAALYNALTTTTEEIDDQLDAALNYFGVVADEEE